jgi:hypothetical protein
VRCPRFARLEKYLHIRQMGEFDRTLKRLVETLHKSHPGWSHTRRLRALVKSCTRNSPGLLNAKFTDGVRKSPEIADAIAARDAQFFISQDANLSPVRGLFLLYPNLLGAEASAIWDAIDGLIAAVDLHQSPEIEVDADAWSDLVTEVLGQSVKLPKARKVKTLGLLELLIGFLDGPKEDIASALDGVDLSAMSDAADTAAKGIIPQLRELLTCTKERAVTTVREFLATESNRPLRSVLRRLFRCVDSRMVFELFAYALERLDVSSVPALVASIQAFEDDPKALRDVAAIARTANVAGLQGLVKDAAQLVDVGSIEKMFGGEGIGGLLEGGIGGSGLSSLGPSLLSRVPTLIGPDGIDFSRLPELFANLRRQPRRPRLSAHRLV